MEMYDGMAEAARMAGALRGKGASTEAARQAEVRLSRLRREMASVYDIIQDADVVPTVAVQEAVAQLARELSKLKTE
jgi:hypothetical protein